MPDSYFHRRLAAGLAGRVSPTARAMTEECRNAFLVGSLGPDPLFAWRFWLPYGQNPVRELGSKLHTHNTGAFLQALLELAKDSTDSTRAYTLGFLCHYGVDSTVHPMVYALTGAKAAGAHFKLERGWDAILYDRDHPKARHSVPPPSPALAALTRREQRDIGACISQAARRSHSSDVTAKQIAQSLRHMAFLDKLLYSPYGGKKAIAVLLDRITRQPDLLSGHFAPPRPPQQDIMNEEHRPWRTPWEPTEEHRESVDELYRAAEALSLQCVNAAAGYFAGAHSLSHAMETIGNRSYHSGKESTAM